MKQLLTLSNSMEFQMHLEEQLAFVKEHPEQSKSLFYDWFCDESSLHRKSEYLLKLVRRVSDSGHFDPKEVYVFFKNNCPMDGPLYDDFRICSLSTGDVLFTVVPKMTCWENKGKSEIWGYANKFHGPLFVGDWDGAVAWFGDQVAISA